MGYCGTKDIKKCFKRRKNGDDYRFWVERISSSRCNYYARSSELFFIISRNFKASKFKCFEVFYLFFHINFSSDEIVLPILHSLRVDFFYISKFLPTKLVLQIQLMKQQNLAKLIDKDKIIGKDQRVAESLYILTTIQNK